jgi:hypothetical protein
MYSSRYGMLLQGFACQHGHWYIITCAAVSTQQIIDDGNWRDVSLHRRTKTLQFLRSAHTPAALPALFLSSQVLDVRCHMSVLTWHCQLCPQARQC